MKEQKNKINKLEAELQYLKDIFLNAKPEAAIKARILSCLQQVGAINKTKTFKTLKKRINSKVQRK